MNGASRASRGGKDIRAAPPATPIRVVAGMRVRDVARLTGMLVVDGAEPVKIAFSEPARMREFKGGIGCAATIELPEGARKATLTRLTCGIQAQKTSL